MAENPLTVWRTTMKRRLVVSAVVLGLWSAVIEARLVYLQIVEHDFLLELADEQQTGKEEIPAIRGSIVDRNGEALALSVNAPTIYGATGGVTDVHATVDALCSVLDTCNRDYWTKRFTEGRFAWIDRLPSREEADRVARLKLPGIVISDQARRFYPGRQLAASVIGWVNVDQRGLSGIEKNYDTVISGSTGEMFVVQNRRRARFRSEIVTPPTVGSIVELTLDKYIQHTVERELAEGVHQNHALSGTVVVQDPWTGEVLAMATFPTFNPNDPNAVPDSWRRNRAVQDLVEPGSAFKIVTAAAALQEHVVTPEKLIDVSEGRLSFGPGDAIEDVHRLGIVPFADVFAQSSNVGSAKVALELGAPLLIDYATRFGFGRRTSTNDFPGEAPGRVWPAQKLNRSALARVAIGYQISVTPIQMATAVSSIANGGELLKPRLVRAIIRGRTRTPTGKQVVNRTVTREVAAQLTAMMERVVDDGTGTAAQIPGYTIAGKTGTAWRWRDGSYSKDYYSSFVGFVPSRAPAYTIVVVIDSPKGRSFYGGAVAAPIFKRIAEALLRYGGVPPTFDPPPQVLVRRDQGTEHPQPATGPLVQPSVIAARLDAMGSDGLYPDLAGMNARDAVRALARLGVQASVRGQGFVIDQQPVAGAPIEPGEKVTLLLERPVELLRTASVAEP